MAVGGSLQTPLELGAESASVGALVVQVLDKFDELGTLPNILLGFQEEGDELLVGLVEAAGDFAERAEGEGGGEIDADRERGYGVPPALC